MKVFFNPCGGRYGYGFDYYCAECETYVGNSIDNEQLIHPKTQTKGKIFRKAETPIACSQVGKVCEVPDHVIEAKEKTL